MLVFVTGGSEQPIPQISMYDNRVLKPRVRDDHEYRARKIIIVSFFACQLFPFFENE